ncbi:hypothetical protein [Haliangium ochraceum]|uniref:hypothetical protein n=1 Tax=Haliangium ochraceum TaxID=80816 RepID=UPI00019BA67A|nr:hypothetical protein [Haliangium ochraceum]
MNRAAPPIPKAHILPLVLCAGALVWHALQYRFVTDDAYISFVFSRNLAEHGALVFNPGLDPVEGYTNFLWTLVIGLLMIAGIAPELSSQVLGVGFALGTMLLAYRLVAWALDDDLGRRADTVPGEGPRSPHGGAWPLLAPALLALSSGFACWSSGGLETQMFNFWVTAALYAYARGSEPMRFAHADGDGVERGDGRDRWLGALGVLLALAAMTRPEGLLITALLGVHRVLANLLGARRLWRTRGELWCVGMFVLVWAPWYAWRWHYYGYPFPNTYYVKAAGEPPEGYALALLQNGIYYVWQWAWQSKAVFAAPVVIAGLLAARPRTRRFFIGSAMLLLGVAYLAYAARVGGDFMGLHRFVMPVFVFTAAGCAMGLWLLLGWLGRMLSAPPASENPEATGRGHVRSVRGLLGLLVAVFVLTAFAVDQVQLTIESLRWGNWGSDRGIDTPAYLRVYTHDRGVIGAHMRECFEDDDFSIVGGAGAQPYQGRMRAIDVFGLVSERVAHEVEPTHPRAGHNKWAPDSLLASLEPDFIFSCYSIHTRPDNPRFNCHPGAWLRRGYEQVTMRVPGLQQQGEYYSFFQRKGRALACPGVVTPPAR